MTAITLSLNISLLFKVLTSEILSKPELIQHPMHQDSSINVGQECTEMQIIGRKTRWKC